MKHSIKWLGALALGAIGFAGCSGGSSSSVSNPNVSLPATSLVAVTAENRLVTFAARTPALAISIPITGIAPGQSLVGVDYRFAPASTVVGNGITGLYALGKAGTTHQLYSLVTTSTSAQAVPVGSPFTLAPEAAAFGFDFNPVVDRIRLVEPTQNRNLRLNPNDGTVFDDPAIPGTTDGTLAYDAADANASRDPNIVAAAYTNVDADPATGTVNYAIDSNNSTLVTQGRPVVGDAVAVSPNTGRLFTVARLSGATATANTHFDIQGTGTSGIVAIGNRIYGINLATGGLTGGAALSLPPGTSAITGLAIVPNP